MGPAVHQSPAVHRQRVDRRSLVWLQCCMPSFRLRAKPSPLSNKCALACKASREPAVVLAPRWLQRTLTPPVTRTTIEQICQLNPANLKKKDKTEPPHLGEGADAAARSGRNADQLAAGAAPGTSGKQAAGSAADAGAAATAASKGDQAQQADQDAEQRHQESQVAQQEELTAPSWPWGHGGSPRAMAARLRSCSVVASNHRFLLFCNQ